MRTSSTAWAESKETTDLCYAAGAVSSREIRLRTSVHLDAEKVEVERFGQSARILSAALSVKMASDLRKCHKIHYRRYIRL